MEDLQQMLESTMFKVCSLIEKIKELEKEIKDVKTENEQLKNKMEKLEYKIEQNTTRNVNRLIRAYSVKNHPKSPVGFQPIKTPKKEEE